MSDFPPLAHAAVTVSDLGRSRPWYNRLIGADPVLDEDTGPFHHVVWLISGTLFGIHQHANPTSSDPFDEHRPGLDHISFGVESRADLEDWATRLDELGITHGDILDEHYGSGLSFRDPDNNALEFFAPPA